MAPLVMSRRRCRNRAARTLLAVMTVLLFGATLPVQAVRPAAAQACDSAATAASSCCAGSENRTCCCSGPSRHEDQARGCGCRVEQTPEPLLPVLPPPSADCESIPAMEWVRACRPTATLERWLLLRSLEPRARSGTRRPPTHSVLRI
jgi:hypothetical protein